jgi:hypothetical protein
MIKCRLIEKTIMALFAMQMSLLPLYQLALADPTDPLPAADPGYTYTPNTVPDPSNGGVTVVTPVPVIPVVPVQQSSIIPEGTVLTVTGVGNVPSNIGDAYTGNVTSSVIVNGATVISPGSHVTGTVVSKNACDNSVNVQFNQICTSCGDTIPICGTATLHAGCSQCERTPLEKASLVYPRVSMGYPCTPAGRIVSGTVGGAVFGAGVGTLAGLVIGGRNSTGTNVARGLGWGAVFGGGLGLVSGLIQATADRKMSMQCCSCSNTTACSPCAQTAVAYQPSGNTCNTCNKCNSCCNKCSTDNNFNLILNQPVTLCH